MSPKLSEFSYGFALVDELIHWHGTPISAVPIYPSLYQEGTLGYDVALDRGGVPLFLQFKLSHYMKRGTAKEVRENKIQAPFYRMHLHQRNHSNQHHLLLALEAAGHQVYYVAPEFYEVSSLNRAYLDHQVRNRSRFVPPSHIGPLPDDRPHHISFRRDQPGSFVFCSTPERREGTMSGRQFDLSLRQSVEKRGQHSLTKDGLVQLLQDMHAPLGKLFSGHEKMEAFLMERHGPLGQIAYLSHVFYGSTFLLVQSQKLDDSGTP